MTESGDREGLPRSLWRALLHPWTWRMAWRDSRTQRHRLAIFGLSIIAGIAALVAIHALNATIGEGIDSEAKSLLGSDLQITSRQAFEPAVVDVFESEVLGLSRETAFATMLSFPESEGARLVQIRGFSGDFPYYGRVETEPEGLWQTLSDGGGILLERSLMEQFELEVGDEVRLGQSSLRILGTIVKALPRSNRFAGFAPEAYVWEGDLEATGLLGARTLASYHLHLHLPGEVDRDEFKEKLQVHPDAEGWRLEVPEDRQEALEEALESMRKFLGISAMVALVLGAVGVASAVRAHLARRVPVVALLRCLGCATGTAYAVYLAQSLVLGLVGTLLGVVVGIGLQLATIFIFREALPFELTMRVPWLEVMPVAMVGFAICCGFALLPLRRLRDIAPVVVLRGGVGLPPGSLLRAWPLFPFLFGLVYLLAFMNTASGGEALALTVALSVAFGVLAATAWGLMVIARRSMFSGWSYWLRQGVANLYRPRNQTLLFLLSLGLAVFLLASILIAERLLAGRISLDQFEESPSLYLVDVQPDQVEGVVGFLEEAGLPVLESAPIVTMRLSAVNDVPVSELQEQGIGPQWIYRREFRSTFRNDLNRTEALVAGEWWQGVEVEEGVIAVSLEEKIADDMKVGLGDVLDLDVQGVPMRARITSLRAVDWSRFNLNFFMVFETEALERAPAFHVVTTRLPEDVSSGPVQRKLVEAYPNVSIIDLAMLLETVGELLGNVALVARILVGFTMVAGLAILIGTFLNGREQRLEESVLLRTLGASRSQIRRLLVIEYAALGVLSAIAGILLAYAGGWLLARYAFQADPVWAPLAVALLGGGAVVVSVAGGLAMSRGVCGHPPLAVLREAQGR